MANVLQNFSVTDLKRAIRLRERIEKLERRLNALSGGSPAAGATATKGRRKLSAAGRARIAAAQRLRWSKNGGKKKTRHKMSPAGRARIAAALRKRWAKVKSTGASTLAG
jgi:hypothetical protein